MKSHIEIQGVNKVFASAGNEVNSEYSNHCGNCKNCYYIFNSEYDYACLSFSKNAKDCPAIL